MKRIYIAGPMTGIVDYNFPAFNWAAAEWRAMGWEVVNPAESFDGATNLPYMTYVEHDIELLRTCHAIAMLRDWNGEGARGSVWEWGVAKQLLGLKVYDADSPVLPPR